MDPFMTNIVNSIEVEIERRVGERITNLLEYISDTCDIPLNVLTKLMLRVEKKKQNSCLAVNKKSNKRCKNYPKENGYCHLHQNQYVPKIIVPPPQTHQKVQHTHTLPPLFMKGCPACESSSTSQSVDEFI